MQDLSSSSSSSSSFFLLFSVSSLPTVLPFPGPLTYCDRVSRLQLLLLVLRIGIFNPPRCTFLLAVCSLFDKSKDQCKFFSRCGSSCIMKHNCCIVDLWQFSHESHWLIVLLYEWDFASEFYCFSSDCM